MVKSNSHFVDVESKPSFRGILDEIQDIFDSHTSLDDPPVDPQEWFGVAEEELVATLDTELPEISLPQDQSGGFLEEIEPMFGPPMVSCFNNPVKAQGSILSPKPSEESERAKQEAKEASKPKRPLSAYNLFFQLERQRLIAGIPEDTPFTAEDVERVAIERRELQQQTDRPKRKHRKSHGKISFAELARKIANKWKILKPELKDLLRERAGIEKARYLRELEEWTKNNSDMESNDFATMMGQPNNINKNYQEFQVHPVPPNHVPSMPSTGPTQTAMPIEYPIWPAARMENESAWMQQGASKGHHSRSSFSGMDMTPPTPRFGGLTTSMSDRTGIKYGFMNNQRALEAEAFAMAERTGFDPVDILGMFQHLQVQGNRRASMASSRASSIRSLHTVTTQGSEGGVSTQSTTKPFAYPRGLDQSPPASPMSHREIQFIPEDSLPRMGSPQDMQVVPQSPVSNCRHI